MLVKTALLILSNPKQLPTILVKIQQQVKSTLYIQLLSTLSEPLAFHSNRFTSWPKYSQTICGIYSEVAQHCKGLDVRVLLSGLKYKDLNKIRTQNTIELVIFDKNHSNQEINVFLQTNVQNIIKKCEVLTLNSDVPYLDDLSINSITDDNVYEHTVLGGTFDRLHTAHKVLLSEAALRAKSKITVGVTEENMLQNKTLWELIEPTKKRINDVEQFLFDICPELNISVVPITDPFGPTQHDPTMQLLVVSAETIKGGQMVNEVRQKKGLPTLSVLPIDLIDEPHPDSMEEEKISSSSTRMRLLGTVLKEPQINKQIPNKPYIIGLTGGIASGKSGIAQHLKELGAHVIDCDKVAHELYQPGKPCHALIVRTFGEKVLTVNKEIDRKVLGGIVFKSPDELQKLNNLLWPVMAEEISNIIKNLNSEVIVVEAAVLLSAKWEKFCHEVWVTIIPKQEAIKRLEARNALSHEQAQNRIEAQSDNLVYVQAANVIFCSLWSVDYTKSQVNRAWSLLQSRLL